MLTERALWQAITCAVESRRAREQGHLPGSVAWIDETVAALDRELEEVARARQSEDDNLLQLADDTDLLTSREVSEMIGWPLRTVQRRADALGAICKRPLLFLPSVIQEHIEGCA